ncbi:MAG: glycosyltransferase [Ginsengibacter sp.]
MKSNALKGMKITAAFTKQFELETLQSEKLRAAILASYALFTGLYILVISYLIKNDAATSETQFPLPKTLLFLLAGLFIYEVFANRILHYRALKFRKSIHPNFKYANAFIELSIITIMLYVYTVFFKHNSLLSDVIIVSLYYLIVFLSAFYLDRYISVVTGIIAASGYTVLHLINQKSVSASLIVEDILYNKYFVYATGILLFLCGIAAAFMAHQLQKGIQRTVELVEDENKLFNLFSRQISKEVAQELLDKDGKVPSELRFVSVMFIDIRNFTVYAETQDPEAIVAFQNTFFAIITEVVHKYEGIVNQFLGDGCMITFGAPLSVDNPAANAVNAAIEINKMLDNIINKKEIHEFTIGVPSLLIVRLLAFLMRSRFVLWGHNINLKRGFQPFSNIADFYRYLLMRTSHGVIFYTPDQMMPVKKYINNKKLFIAYNALDTNMQLANYNRISAASREEIKKEMDVHTSYNLIFISRLLPTKKPEQIIEIYCLLDEKIRKDVSVHIIGSGPMYAPMQEMINQSGYSANIKLYGEITDEVTLGKLLYLSDFMINPGYLGLSVNLSFAYGCPIITFDNEEMEQTHSPEVYYLRDGFSGIKIKNLDLAEMAAALSKSLEDGSYRKMRENCLQTIYKEGSIEQMFSGFENAILFNRN